MTQFVLIHEVIRMVSVVQCQDDVYFTFYSRLEKLLGPVYTELCEFENGGFTLKTNQVFNVHTTPEKSKKKNATITGHFAFVSAGNSGREFTRSSVIQKLRFQNVFCPH